ncbi:MAG: hypothetical protein ACM3ZV_08200 [Bacillota bacterium]
MARQYESNPRKWIALTAAAFVFAGVARAGTLGPTSAGTVSISVRVAPSFEVRPTWDVVEGAAGEGLCAKARGIGAYRLLVLSAPAENSSAQDAPLAPEVAGGCGTDAAVDLPNAVRATPGGRITLLVVPE